MDLERALNEIVFELTPFPADHELLSYIDEYKNPHKVLVNEIDEEENENYFVPICETLLRVVIDDTNVYLAQVASRLYVNEAEYYELSDWRCF